MVERASGWIYFSQVVVVITISYCLANGSGPEDWGETTRGPVAAAHTLGVSTTSRSRPPVAHPSAPFLTKLVQLHSYYCGSNRICQHYSASECYRCAPCKCDVSCHKYGDCCPDVSEREVKQSILSSNVDCLSSNVPTASLVDQGQQRSKDLEFFEKMATSPVRYFMISRCPSNFNGEKQKCERLNGEPPVSSRGNNSVVYKNQHCAICNGLSSRVVDQWQLRISCAASKNFTPFHSTLNVGYATLLAKDCTISYAPSMPNSERRCYRQPDMISTCNETGEMHSIDPFHQKACDNYLSPKTVDGKTYENVFCYLCNRNNTPFTSDPGQCGSDPFNGKKSLEVTVDKSDLPSEWISKSLLYDAGYDVCGDSGLYDSTEKICRPMFCSFAHRMRPGGCSCSPAFRQVKGLAYEIYFKLQPDAPVELSDEFDLLHHLPKDMEIHLGRLLQKIHVKIEDFAMAFNTTDDRGRCSQATSDFSLYARVKGLVMTDQRELQKQLKSLRKRKFHIVSRQWNVSLQSIPCEQPWHLMHPSRLPAPRFKDPCVTIVANYQNVKKREDGTKRVGTTTPSPEILFARMTTPPDIRISNLLSCAQVKLFSNEYTLSSIGNSLLFTWNGGSKIIPEDRYLLDLNGNVTICLSDFLAKLTNKYGQRRTDAETTCALIFLPISMSCLLVCLVIFALFPVLRSLSGKNNIILVTCLFLSQLAMFIGYIVEDTSVACTIMGVFFHYFSLSLFLALAICSYHVYTIFNFMHLSVDITKETRAFVLYCACIFVIPFVIIVIVFIVSNQTSSLPSDVGYGVGPICFLSSSTTMWVTLFLPLVITTAIAVVLFSMTFCTLQNNADVETNATDERHVHFYFRSAVLTCVTWIVGAVALQAFNGGIRIAFILCQLVLGIYIMFGLVCTRRVAGLVSSICCCGTSRAKNNLNIKMDGGKPSGASTSHPSVIFTSFKPKDSPRILENNEKPFFSDTSSNGYTTEESHA